MENSLEHFRTFVVDRFEGEYAILSDSIGKNYDVLREDLPKETREGDVLHEDEGAYVFDEVRTTESREKLKRLYDELAKG
jgi:hypothetical protein